MAMRWTTRRMMVVVAVIAVLLGIVTGLHRAYRRQFFPTPVEWALDQAASWEHYVEDPTVAARYRELAEAFARSGEPDGEGTLRGPFSDRLVAGQAVVIKPGSRATPADAEGRPLEKASIVRVAQETAGAVLLDRAGDDDDCDPLRPILVRFVDDQQHEVDGNIERIDLRRR